MVERVGEGRVVGGEGELQLDGRQVVDAEGARGGRRDGGLGDIGIVNSYGQGGIEPDVDLGLILKTYVYYFLFFKLVTIGS